MIRARFPAIISAISSGPYIESFKLSISLIGLGISVLSKCSWSFDKSNLCCSKHTLCCVKRAARTQPWQNRISDLAKKAAYPLLIMKAPDLRSLLAIIDNPKDCPKKPNTPLLKIEKN